MVTLSSSDLAQLQARRLSISDIEAQMARLRVPPRPIRLDRPCAVGDGILQLDPTTSHRFLDLADAAAAAGRITKFIPASGAATRMFRDLIAARAGARRPSDSPAVRELFDRLDDFPFGPELRRAAGVPGRPATEAEERHVLAVLLDEMRFAELPKALIPFHRADRTRTAFEEHLLEGTRYARAADGTCLFHFTVAAEFKDAFEAMIGRLAPEMEAQRRGAAVRVSLSEQHASTDTVSLDSSGNLFRSADGSILFRPSGHGALLRNLEDLGADLVVIKNIDNVVPDETSVEVVRWKRLLIGCLADIQSSVFERLAALSQDDCPAEAVDEALVFAASRFARVAPTGLDGPARRAFAIDALDRPLRIAGVVRNSGEPGGAPFWVSDEAGSLSIQIVESSQVDLGDPDQSAIFGRSTHFNPVDLVCALRTWRGEPHQLARFVDNETAFVTSKTAEGRDLTALERPGLWNGAMAGWNTVCVEVPETTFAPVKTVFDLLRPQHLHRTAAPPAALDAHSTGRVLVIDDQRINQRILEQILAGAGLEVVAAGDGERGLEIVQAGGVDLVLLDIVLPGLDGFEVLARLQEMPETQSIPVVLISSLDDVSDKVRGLECGAADYVTKPFDQQDVLARVRAQLRIRRLSAEVQLINSQLVQKQELIDEDLKAAADIQRALLPPAETSWGRVTTASVFQPSFDVGGDIFNIVRRPEGTLAFFIADVSGHGVASALLTVSLTQWLSSPAGLGRPAGVSPAALLHALEQQYPFERFGKYFSILVVLLHPESGRFQYSAAGHPAPFIVRATGQVKHLGAGGPVIGMGFGLPFDEGVESLEVGDRLVLYTDGAVEDLSANGVRFGVDRLVSAFTENPGRPLSAACADVLAELSRRRGDVPASDDIAILALERH